MTRTAHPEDILITGTVHEARMYEEFDPRQVISAGGGNIARSIEGRRFRHVYVTDMALWNMDSNDLYALDIGRVLSGGEIRDIASWRPEPEPKRSIWTRLLDLCERFG